jgi:precorrin-2 dehydrogenase / sirohydrochlorin ferrochelatase
VSIPRPLPVGLRLAGRRCLVAGGGAVAERRVRRLLDAGAAVTVVAPAATPVLADLARHDAVVWHRREFRDDDAPDAFLVVAATDRAGVNGAVARAARAAGALVNRTDDAASGDVDLAAEVRRGPLSVAVSTGGTAPAVTAWATDRLEAGLDDALGLDSDAVALLVEVVAEVRAEQAATASVDDPGDGAAGGTAASLDWRSALDRTMLDLIIRGRKAQAKERLQACLSSS